MPTSAQAAIRQGSIKITPRAYDTRNGARKLGPRFERIAAPMIQQAVIIAAIGIGMKPETSTQRS
jgi:hypothetical protein